MPRENLGSSKMCKYMISEVDLVVWTWVERSGKPFCCNSIPSSRNGTNAARHKSKGEEDLVSVSF
jgi:hypothetical protein